MGGAGDESRHQGTLSGAIAQALEGMTAALVPCEVRWGRVPAGALTGAASDLVRSRADRLPVRWLATSPSRFRWSNAAAATSWVHCALCRRLIERPSWTVAGNDAWCG